MVEDLPTLFDASTCTRKGFCPVTVNGETHRLYYEQHGTGSIPVVFVNGLNTSSFAWNFQVEALLARQDEYTVIVFDSRGVGYSGYPTGRYTTSAMAEDVVTLLDFLKISNNIHLVGTSFGGMICQEIAFRIPTRISSLILAVTTPGGKHVWNNLPPLQGLKFLIRIFLANGVEKKVPIVMEMLFPLRWLDQKDERDSRTNREIQIENEIRRELLTQKQHFMGTISQMCAALTHYMSSDRLGLISRSVPKVVIVCGDDDHLVGLKHSRRLKAAMPEAEFIQWKDTGHGIHFQRPKEFHELLIKTSKEAIGKKV